MKNINTSKHRDGYREWVNPVSVSERMKGETLYCNRETNEMEDLRKIKKKLFKVMY